MSVSLKQLADKLGLGKATVQRALSGQGKVKPATRERVLRLAEEMGYKRNLYFAALAAQRRRNSGDLLLIHYICQNFSADDRRNVGFDESRWLKAGAERLGIQVVRVDPNLENAPRSLPKRLWNRGSAGFLLGNCGTEFLEGLQEFEQLPVLNLLLTEDLPYHAVGFDVAKAVKMCWRHLRAAGHRRIGIALLGHDRPTVDDFRRLATAQALLDESAPRERQVPVLMATVGARGEIAAWVNRHSPEAVIGFSAGMFWECNPDGCPQLPFVTLHANLNPQDRHIPGTMQPFEIHAERALEQLDLMIRHGQHGRPPFRHTLLVDPVWYNGHTNQPHSPNGFTTT